MLKNKIYMVNELFILILNSLKWTISSKLYLTILKTMLTNKINKTNKTN